MTLTGYFSDANAELGNVNRLLKPLGLSYVPTAVLPKSDASTVAITSWDAQHPIAEGVGAVGVDNGYPVQGSKTLVAWKNSVHVGRAVEVGTGRAFVRGDEWVTYDSGWKTTNYKVERFWLNSLKWLTPANQCQVNVPPQYL